ALRRPETLTTPGFRPVSVRLKDGRTLSGLAKNESNYDLQLQSTDGVLHVLSKDQIEKQSRELKSLMPATNATNDEMRDLLAFLTRLTDGALTNAAVFTKGTDPNAFAEIANPKPGNWPTYNGQLSGNRHSGIDEINLSNVAKLAPKWMFPIAN